MKHQRNAHAMLERLEGYRVVLGSQSPRRAELLSGLDVRFVQEAMPDLDESYPEDLPTDEVAPYIARAKAEAYRPRMQRGDLLVTADTVVICPQKDQSGAELGVEIFGKPTDRADARRMLGRLSGRKHSVVTGYALTTLDHQVVGSCLTIVDFAPLSETDIDYYLDHYAPYDKAGAYGIQEWIGYRAIRGIEGSYYNVMGLPVQRLSESLLELLDLEEAGARLGGGQKASPKS